MNNENKIKYDSSVGKLLENIKVDYSKFMSNLEMVENFNKYCSIIAKMWNTYNPEYMMTADEIQIKMTEEETQNPYGHLSKFIEPKKPNQPNQPKA